MKKLLIGLVAMVCFGINAYADSVKTCQVKSGETTIGYVTAYIDRNGDLNVSNDTNKRVTVSVTTTSGVTVVSVEAGKTETKKGFATQGVVKVENAICSN